MPYLHDEKEQSFVEAIDTIKPHVLIGATGSPGSFTQNIIEKMCKHNDRPTIFALSNPTSHAECTAEQAYTWSNGKAVFASGSPFDDVELNGKTFKPGQGNNAYIFPGIGLGAVVSESKIINDEMFLIAAKELASQVSDQDLAEGALYPPLTDIRRLSVCIASVIVEYAYQNNLAKLSPKPEDIKQCLIDYMYDPTY